MENKSDSRLTPIEQLEAMIKKFEDASNGNPDPKWAGKWIDAAFVRGRKEALAEGLAKGRTEGRAEALGAIRQNLCAQAESRFDPKTTQQLARRLDKISDPDLLWKISRKIHKSTTSASLLKYLKTRT